MSLLTDKFYTETNSKPTQVYIETGTYLGLGLIEVFPHYKEVHSIELALKYFHFNEVQFSQVEHVHMHHGNSKYVLPMLLAKIKEPVTVFLDGHFLGGDSAFGDESADGVSSCPLEGELLALYNRPYDDIIIIDDTRCIGNRGVVNPGTGTTIYPEYEYDWRHITEDTIRGMLKPGYEIYKNDNNQYATGKTDQWICYRKPKSKKRSK